MVSRKDWASEPRSGEEPADDSGIVPPYTASYGPPLSYSQPPTGPFSQQNIPPDLGVGEIYGPPVIGPAHARPVAQKKRRWPWYVGGFILLFFMFAACSAILATGRSTTPPIVVAPVPSQAVEGPVFPSATDTASTSASAPAAPASDGKSFSEGEWLVGKDKEVLPGTYRTPGAADRGNGIVFCAAIIKKDGELAGSSSSSKSDAPARIVLKEGQTVNSNGCQTWQKVG